ncbi:MAG TPA: hypothetical protein VH853_01110 [Polyangia bacterium]|jgi:hypothetical protein|nr:hypothetical protein [Polyangia bacterium]
MRDPVRLRDEGASALERALLAAGTSYRSSSETRTKTLAALGVAGSATLLAGAAQATTLGSLAKMTWGKLLAAVSIVGAAAAVPGYYAWQRHQTAKHRASAPVAVAVAASSVEVPDWLSAPAQSEQVNPRARRGSINYAPLAGAPNDAPAHAVRPVARPSVTLAHELSSIDAARGMLARGDAAGALARLDAYGRAYPHGRLSLEAEVLRIDALDENGRGDVARARAAAFLQRHPHSVLAARVRTRLGD